MAQENWLKVKDIFWEALDQPENARAEFVKNACGDDTELLREVESLIEANQESKPLLEDKNYNLASFLTPEEKKYEGKTFGHYNIIREIGRGGMGAVFLVERNDGEFSQQGALKIVRQTVVDGELERRFKRERQILASLNHPNIAQLLDGGVSAEGEPYLVMEYIEGEPLIDFAEAQDLTIEERLDLFVKVCSAVAYAHRNLVVHRDIKPNNILVTADGEPKLLDFGLAKFLDTDILGRDEKETATQYRAFTLAYASPEQIRGGRVTTASDVYSLSVVLYELLTGTRPFHFENKSLDDILKTVGNSQPQKPSDVLLTRKAENTTNEMKHGIQNLKLLKGDLDNICLMGLRNEPERRYQSVERLAEDIKRHLKGLPILARPQTFSYQASKFFKRNKITVLASLLVVLSLIGGIAVSLWQASVARQQRDRAEKRFNDIRKLSNSLLFEISPRIERVPGTTEAREILVTRALEYLDSLAGESSDDLQLQNELASAYEKVGNVQGRPGYPNLGDLRGATESYEKAHRIRERLAEKSPDDLEIQRQLAVNIYAIGDIKWWSSDVTGALQNYQNAADIYEKLAAQKPDNVDSQLEYLLVMRGKTQTLSNNGDYESSIRVNKELLEKVGNLQKKFPQNADLQRLFPNLQIRIAYDLSWQDDMRQADEWVKKSMAYYEPLLKSNPTDTAVRRDLWYAYFEAGAIYIEANKPLSHEYLQKSATVAKETSEKDPSDFQSKHDLVQSYSKLGENFSLQNNLDAAIDYLKKAQVILDEMTAAEPRHAGYRYSSANNYARLAAASAGNHDNPGAVENYKKAIALLEQIHQTDEQDNSTIRALAVAAQDLAETYEKSKLQPEAAAAFQKSLDMFVLLQKNNALAAYDEKNFEKTRKGIERVKPSAPAKN